MLLKVTCFEKINFKEHRNVPDDDEMSQQISSKGNMTAGCVDTSATTSPPTHSFNVINYQDLQ